MSWCISSPIISPSNKRLCLNQNPEHRLWQTQILLASKLRPGANSDVMYRTEGKAYEPHETPVLCRYLI